ncbi:MFS transporter [Pseudorhodoplanes sp.]|uniref:MFS transporter n=1 Tax=Pseudorhodoplanes sp. TaxID=1934341 RepID=UPI003D0DCF69
MIPVIIACCNFMVTLSHYSILTALPDIGRSLGEPPSHLGQLITVYIASLIISMPLSSWLADRFGLRNVYGMAILIFGLSSALGGLATDIWTLTGVRIVQGFGAALIGTLGQVVILGFFPRNQTLRLSNYQSIARQTAQIVAPLVGGTLATYISWRWIFLINAPVILAAAVAAFLLFPTRHLTRRARLDIPGFVLFSLGIALLIFGLSSLGTHGLPVWGAAAELAIAGAILAAFVWYCMRTTNPLLSLSLFRLRTLRVSLITGGGLDTIGLASVSFLLPLMFQIGFGMTAAQSGALTFLTACGSLVMRFGVPQMLRRFGFRSVLIWNTPIAAALVAAFALTSATTPIWIVAAHIFALGLFRAMQWSSAGNLSYAEIATEDLTQFSALYYIFGQLALALSIALASGMISFLAGGENSASISDFHFVFFIQGIITLCSWFAYRSLQTEDGAQVSGHAVHAASIKNSNS